MVIMGTTGTMSVEATLVNTAPSSEESGALPSSTAIVAARSGDHGDHGDHGLLGHMDTMVPAVVTIATATTGRVSWSARS